MEAIWHNTVGYGATAPKLAYLSDAENRRLERLRVARMLWKGWHRHCFLHEARTQWDFPEMEVQDRVIRPYVTFNVLKLISTTLTDLLLGEEPLLAVDDELGQAAIDDLRTRSDLHRVFYDAVRSASWGGEGMVEVTRWDGQVWVQDVKAREVFPQGERQPDGQYLSYRRYATATIAGERRLLLETTYLPGQIQRQCYLLQDGAKKEDAKLDLWPVKRADGSALLPTESTGIEWNTMVWVANEIDDGEPTSDYDGLIELQDELNAKQTQIARVIAKHADPKMALPEASADDNGQVKANWGAWFYRNKEEIPSYIVWNAELAAAIEDRDFSLNGLCIAAELSPGLMGLEKGAAPDSARKLRLQATKSLARMKRKSTFVRPFIKTSIDTALQLMVAGRRVQISMGSAAADLRDGLPVDELDQAQTISMLTGGKATMSVERAVEMQIPDPVAAAEEVDRLKADAAAATPSVLIGTSAGPEIPGTAAAAPPATIDQASNQGGQG
jgi:hypothetical protein